jgi:hypothetical protein
MPLFGNNNEKSSNNQVIAYCSTCDNNNNNNNDNNNEIVGKSILGVGVGLGVGLTLGLLIKKIKNSSNDSSDFMPSITTRNIALRNNFNLNNNDDNKHIDIDKLLKNLSLHYHIINTNINKLKNNSANEKNFKNIVQNFINPHSKKQLKQNKSSYYYVCNVKNNNSNKKYFYNWNYPNWEGTCIKDINDPKNNSLINSMKNSKPLNMVFDNSINAGAYYLENSSKLSINRTFTNNGKKYIIGSGLDLNDYDFNKTKKEKEFINYFRNYKKYLQNIVYRIKNIESSKIHNFNNANEFLSSISDLYPLKKINVYIPDYDNFNKTMVYNINYNTLKKVTKLKTINESKLSFIKNIYKTYSSGNENKEVFNDGDYGLIQFSVNDAHWLSIFYVNYDDNVQKIISLELNISDYY